MSRMSHEFRSENFEIGPVVCSKGVYETMKEDLQFGKDVVDAMLRYCRKDWGMLTESDILLNEEALCNPADLYLIGTYVTSTQGKIYIITNRISETLGDNATTICFPFER